MLRLTFVLLAFALCGWRAMAAADVVQLKDNAAVTGKILAEKRDQVVVDIGYTVLSIPRNQITKLSKANAPEATPAPVVASLAPVAVAVVNAPVSAQGGYFTANT